ncbi:MAG: phosphotransferase [Pseudomonadota bacterium]
MNEDGAESSNVGAGLFKFFLTIPDRASIFVYDAHESVTLSMSVQAKQVISCCNSLEKARTVKNRLENGVNSNVHVIVGDPLRLPFRSESFDIACFFHQLPDDVPQRGKTQGLSYPEIARTLKTDGECYISFEDTQKGSLGKRMLRNVLGRTFSGLKSAGLERKSIIDHYPELTKIHFVKVIEAENAWQVFANLKSLVKICLVRNNLAVVLRRKPAPKITNGLSLLAGIGRELGDKGIAKPRMPKMVRLGSGGSVVADYGSVIVRLPQTDVGRKRCINGYDALSKLDKAELSFKAPKPMATGCYKHQDYYAESKLEGISLDLEAPNQANSELIYRRAMEMLKSDSIKLGAISPTLFSVLVQEEANSLIGVLEQDDALFLEELAGKMKAAFLDDELPVVIHHGDFKFSNFLCSNKGEIRGVIDWDLARIPGLPLYDVLTLYFSSKMASGRSLLESLSRMVSVTETHDDIDCYVDKLGISRRGVRYLAIMAIVKHINDHYYSGQMRKSRYFYNNVIRKHLIAPCRHVLDNWP